MKRLSLCALLFLVLCWGCGDTPPSVMEMVLPDKDMPPNADAMGPFEIEAIFATEGEVHSPIPDDVYEDLWGHWTLAGLSTPRSYYTKFIDADGIAIVGGDTIPDGAFQEARHIVLVMTAKLPALRKALSRKTRTSIHGLEEPFRIVIREGLYERYPGEVDPDPEASLRRVLEAIPEYSKGGTISGTGQFYAYPLCVVSGGTWPEGSRNAGKPALGNLVHEFAHAVHGALVDHAYLFPEIKFAERLDNTWERQMEHHRKREEEGLVGRSLAEKYPVCVPKEAYANVNPWEYWAVFVAKEWFDDLHKPEFLAKYPPPEYGNRRENCGEIVDMASDVFPAFPLHMAKNQIDYTRF